MDKAFDVFPLLFKNLETVELLLREKRSLREELVSFFRSLDEIWQKLPIGLENAQRLALLEDVIRKYVTETWQNCSFLEAQVAAEFQVAALRARQEAERRQEEVIAGRLREAIRADYNQKVVAMCEEAVAKLNVAQANCWAIPAFRDTTKELQKNTIDAIKAAIEVLSHARGTTHGE